MHKDHQILTKATRAAVNTLKERFATQLADLEADLAEGPRARVYRLLTVTDQEQSTFRPPAERGSEPNTGGVEVLCFVDDHDVVWSIVVGHTLGGEAEEVGFTTPHQRSPSVETVASFLLPQHPLDWAPVK